MYLIHMLSDIIRRIVFVFKMISFQKHIPRHYNAPPSLCANQSATHIGPLYKVRQFFMGTVSL